MTLITAKQYGEKMRMQGVLWPAPAIALSDQAMAGVTIWQVGGRSVENVFVLERRGWATVYVAPKYLDYRKAFDQAMPRTSSGLDVDHLFPKSRARQGDYLALGRIGMMSNQSWSADDSPQALAQKVRDMGTKNPHSFTSMLTDLERGWAVVTCYIRPMSELQTGALTKVDLKKA